MTQPPQPQTLSRQNWLDAILQDMSLSDFTKCIGRRPILLAGSEGKCAELLSWPMLNSLLNTHSFTPASLRVVKGGQDLPRDSFTRESKRKRGGDTLPEAVLDSHAVTQAMRDGATLVINSIHRRIPDLAVLARHLSVGLDAHVSINMYAALHEQHGFDIHYDTHDVLVLQVHGHKRWQLFGQRAIVPLQGEAFEPAGRSDLAGPVWDEMLTDGDALYLPRGWWHVAKPTGATIHLTCGIVRPTGVDLLQWVIRCLSATNLTRVDMPRQDEPARQYLESLRESVTALLTSKDALDHFAADRAFADADFWEPRFALPWTATQDVLPPSGGSMITLPAPGALQPWPDPNDVSAVRLLRAGKSVLTLPARVTVFCEWLRDRAPVSVDAFVAEFAGSVGEDALRKFLTDLASAGLVCVEPSSAEPSVADAPAGGAYGRAVSAPDRDAVASHPGPSQAEGRQMQGGHMQVAGAG